MSGGPRPTDGWGLEFGKYHASGKRSADLLGEALEQLVVTDVYKHKGWRAQLRYLSRGPVGRAALRAAVAVRDATIDKWRSGGNTTRRNQQAVTNAYKHLRGQRAAEFLVRRLEREGRGTRIEIVTVDQRAVPANRQREIEDHRQFNVTRWAPLVVPWAVGDVDGMRLTWDDELMSALGSDWHTYQYATSVGILAH